PSRSRTRSRSHREAIISSSGGRSAMRREVGITIALMVILLCAGGCGTVGNRLSRIVLPSEQERNLASALEYLRTGNEDQATYMLEQVVAAPPIGGVTDEALFRLAVLHLTDDAGKGTSRSKTLLEKLQNEYPRSIWAHQAAPLNSYLASVKKLRDREKEL